MTAAKKNPTLKEIADIAGVSVATVSYALNGKKKISEKTKTKILGIMKELNYTPNFFAQNLRTKDSRLVFALTPSFSSIFSGEMLGILEEKFEKHGLQLLAMSSIAPSILKSNIFDGGIILNFDLTSEEINTFTDIFRKQIVSLSGDASDSKATTISMNNDEGIHLMMKELAKSQHEKICFMQGSPNSLNNQERYKSAKKYFKQYFNRDDFEIHVYTANFDSIISYHLALSLLKAKIYNSFFCFNDSMALGVYQAAQELGLEVGKDISVVGFDNNFISEYISPKLTTVDIDKEVWTTQIVDTYLKLRDEQKVPQLTKVPATVIKRQSIAYKKEFNIK